MRNDRASVVMLSPEPPYPLHGGGAYRIASLLHYFAQFADVDLIQISETTRPALLPAGLVRSQTVIPLPPHSRATLARFIRNARRAIVGVPPLIDRLAGLGSEIAQALTARKYDLGIIEHFWCAPYVTLLREACSTTVLDLHNVESSLHERCASIPAGRFNLSQMAIRAGHRWFAKSARCLESKWIEQFDLTLVTSQADLQRASKLAPSAKYVIYPNSLPARELPAQAEARVVVFSGNFEYHPNADAVRFLTGELWPSITNQFPECKLRLLGRGAECVRDLARPGDSIELTGMVEDAAAEIAKAALVIVPLRTGSGTRVKILEAWSAARAVISTPLGAEGLRFADGENIVLAGTASELINGVATLLRNPDYRIRLGQKGRETFEQYYTWPAAWSQLDSALRPQIMPGIADILN